MGSGDWDQRIELGEGRPERDDEVLRLAREFNLMADALAERERRLIRGERLAAVGQLAAQITHEIRNPLSSVGLNVELLEDRRELDLVHGLLRVGARRLRMVVRCGGAVVVRAAVRAHAVGPARAHGRVWRRSRSLCAGGRRTRARVAEPETGARAGAIYS